MNRLVDACSCHERARVTSPTAGGDTTVLIGAGLPVLTNGGSTSKIRTRVVGFPMVLGLAFDDPPGAGLSTGICSVKELSASSETEAQSRRKVPTRADMAVL